MLLGILVLFTRTALAHDPGLSSAEVHLRELRIVAEVSFALTDLERIQTIDLNGDSVVSTRELDDATPHLAGVAGKLLDIQCDSRKFDLQKFHVEMRDKNSVHFLLEFPSDSTSQLKITAPVLSVLPRGHKQFLSVRDQRNRVLAERMLSAESNQLSIDVRSMSPPVSESFFRFLILGIEHILTGYDHLVFLLALLLAGGSLASNAKIITSFTVAHSMTLVLATLGLVSMSPSIVEPLIAVSIVFVGIENLVRWHLTARWLVTFGFGLIHGLGFASVLRDLGISGFDAYATAMPLLSFNLGAEVAQVAIAGLVLPLVWHFQRRPAFAAKYTPALSFLIVLAGAFWFLARTIWT